MKKKHGGRPVGFIVQQYENPVTFPSGRVRRHRRPFSAWQKLIEGRRIAKDLSVRNLATAASSKTAPLSHTRLWNWLRHPDGYPPRNAYSEVLNAKLARALGLDPLTLAQAYEESRRHLASGNPAPDPAEPLHALREAVLKAKRKSWTTAQVCELIDSHIS